jgi:outer membrane murein-binding lipoprotein Lpp
MEISQLRGEVKELQSTVERLCSENTGWEREKRTAESKSRWLGEKVTQLDIMVDQAKVEVEISRAETTTAREELAKLSSKLETLKVKTIESDAQMCGGVSRARALLCDGYRGFGASIALFDEEKTGVCDLFIGWIGYELGSLTTVIEGLMGYSTLVTHTTVKQQKSDGSFMSDGPLGDRQT